MHGGVLYCTFATTRLTVPTLLGCQCAGVPWDVPVQ
jgi:hypothetical protein